MGSSIGFKPSVYLSYRTQVAKYLPGNVFHHLGRVVLAKQQGVNASIASIATILESIILVLLAGLLGVSFLITQGYGALGLIMVLVGGLAVVIALNHPWLRSKLGVSDRLRFNNLTWGILSFVSYGAVFFLQATMFVLFAGLLAEPLQLGFARILEMVSVTWAAGFVVIGAPGGLGVREAAFSLFAESPEMKLNFLFVASWMRVSSILGDLICFGLSGLFLKSPGKTKKNG